MRSRRSLTGALAAALWFLAALPAQAAAPMPPATCPTPGEAPAPAGSAAELCRQKQLVDQVRSQLSVDLASSLAAQEQLQQSLRDNAQEQDALTAEVQTDAQRLAEADAQIAALDLKMAETQTRIASDRRQIGMVARALYFEPPEFLLRLIRAGGLRQMLVEAGDLTAAAARGQALQDQLQHDLDTYLSEQGRQRAARQQRAAVLATRQSQLQQMQQLQANQQRLSAGLAGKIATTQSELSGLTSQDASLVQRILQQQEAEQDQLIAAGMQQVWNQVQLWLQANPTGPVPTSSGHSARYRFIWPEPTATISQGFGPTTLWFEPSFAGYLHFHTGVDLAAPMGTPVLAADDGVVALVGSGTTGYGNYVVIAHSGGMTTLYGHLEAGLVRQGQPVTQGQTIGLEGSTGASTGPHCHFELRVNQQPIDPSPYLPPGPPSAFRA